MIYTSTIALAEMIKDDIESRSNTKLFHLKGSCQFPLKGGMEFQPHKVEEGMHDLQEKSRKLEWNKLSELDIKNMPDESNRKRKNMDIEYHPQTPIDELKESDIRNSRNNKMN